MTTTTLILEDNVLESSHHHLLLPTNKIISITSNTLRLQDQYLNSLITNNNILSCSDPIQSISYDSFNNRLAAVAHNQITVWESLNSEVDAVPDSLHSTFSVNHSVSSIDYVQGTIAAIGQDVISIWSLNERSNAPIWSRIALQVRPSTILLARLSPSADMLASVDTGSNIVRLSKITSTGIDFTSQIIHSLPVQSLQWRPSTESILFTTTIDGVCRIWGGMIDEPHHFSLFATLNLSFSDPTIISLVTRYIKSTPIKNGLDQSGMSDTFITISSDGAVHETVVRNFDCRPPKCLSQTSRQIQSNLLSRSQLVNLRNSLFISDPLDPCHLSIVARCSRGTLLRVEVYSDHRTGSTIDVPVNLVGTIQDLVASSHGDAFIVRGEQGKLQSWVIEADKSGVTESYIAESTFEAGSKIECWDKDNSLAVIDSTTLRHFSLQPSGRLALASSIPVSLPSPPSHLAVIESDTTPILIAISSCHRVFVWIVTLSQLEFVSSHTLVSDPASELAFSKIVPYRTASADTGSLSALTLSETGILSFWSLSLPLASGATWQDVSKVRTNTSGILLVECNQDSVSAIVSGSDDQYQLSIWDSRESEFASGQQFHQVLENEVLLLQWSIDGGILATASHDRIDLLCSQRLDDLSEGPGWTTFATIPLDSIISSPVVAIRWMTTGQLVVAFKQHLVVYSSQLSNGEDCHRLAAEKSAPLPFHHPQLLFQSLLHGKTSVVVRILSRLARSLTATGEVTPLADGGSIGAATITVDDFLIDDVEVNSKVQSSAPQTDIFAALTSAQARKPSKENGLTEEHTNRLLAALKTCPLKGLSKLEHAHLALLVQNVFEIQSQRNSLDPNGLRYLISMRSYYIYSTATASSEILPKTRIKYRDMLWAYHSESQDIILDASIRTCPGGKLDWRNAKALGIFIWLKSPLMLARQMEAIGQCEFRREDDERDPITASLFWLALKKKHIVMSLWRESAGHSEKQAMLKFLLNDFNEPRWKSAALKNAYALISKRRFMFAATFFLLADSLKDAVNVILRQLDDFQLAIAITRVHEGDDGPVLKSILENSVLPIAFKNGYRWLASWAFWMLKRRDLAIQTIITPLADLASSLPYSLVSIGSPMHEDPCLVLLLASLRSWSLQTVKGAIAIPGRTEFNFILHMSRVLCRMGCHVLALDLVRKWEFIHPTRTLTSPLDTVPHRRSSLGRHSLRRLSTKVDVDIPSTLPSRAPSPTEFLAVLKDVQKAAKAPQEFDMNDFF